MWITQRSRNMISLWWLSMEASFGEIVWGVPPMLCVMFVKDGIMMDWPLEIVGEMWNSMWCVDEFMLFSWLLSATISRGAHTNLYIKDNPSGGKSLRSQSSQSQISGTWGWIIDSLFLRNMTLSFHGVNLATSTNARHNQLARACHYTMVRVYFQESSNLKCVRSLSSRSFSDSRPMMS